MKHSKNHNELVALASKQFAGEISMEEKSRLEALLESEENLAQYEQLKKVWESSEKASGFLKEEVEAEWLRLRDQLRKTKTKSFAWWRVAASVALFTLLGLTWYLTEYSSTSRLVAEQVQIQTLSDGTSITLNANSELKYPKKFEGNKREVSLKGEAFFEVEKNPEKPFIIHTPSLEVGVLGTSFLVRDQPNEKTATVVVSSGSVSVSYRKKRVELEIGEKALLDKTTGNLYKAVNDDPNFISWKTKKFTFDDIPLEEVVKVLNNAYHQNIYLGSEAVKFCPITVTFDSQSLESILDVLETTLNLTIKKTSQGIEISGQGC